MIDYRDDQLIGQDGLIGPFDDERLTLHLRSLAAIIEWRWGRVRRMWRSGTMIIGGDALQV